MALEGSEPPGLGPGRTMRRTRQQQASSSVSRADLSSHLAPYSRDAGAGVHRGWIPGAHTSPPCPEQGSSSGPTSLPWDIPLVPFVGQTSAVLMIAFLLGRVPRTAPAKSPLPLLEGTSERKLEEHSLHFVYAVVIRDLLCA